MASFNGNIPTPENRFNLLVEYNYTQSIETNKSTINSIVGYVKRNNTNVYPYNYEKTATITIERKNEEDKWVTVDTISDSSGYNLGSDGYKTFVSGSDISIPHKSNGTQKIRITFSVDGKLSNYYPIGSISQEIDLLTIPRASDIAVANSDLEQNIPITIGKKVDSFTSTLTYTIGTLTGTIVEKTNLSSYPWVMTEELISQIKNAYPNTGSYAKGGIEAKVTCKTYNGTTLIGSKDATFKLYITDKPTITNVVRAELNSNISALTTNVLRHVSQNQFTITASAPTGATIASYRVKNGTQDSGLSTNNVVNLNDIQNFYEESNTLKTKFIVTCIDSRGNESVEYPVVCSFTNYIQVSINKTDVSIKRSSGTSTDCKIYATGNFFNGKIGTTDNLIAFKVRYKLKEETEYSSWTTLSTTYVDNTFKVDNVALLATFDYTKNYDIELMATDKIGELDDYSKVFVNSIPTEKHHSKGAWIRELSCDELKVDNLDALNILKNKTIYDSGSNADGSYVQFNDGTMICYGIHDLGDVAMTTTFGSMYEKSHVSLGNFPKEFADIPAVHVTTIGGCAVLEYLNSNDLTTTSLGVTDFMRPTASTQHIKIAFIAIGHWKTNNNDNENDSNDGVAK